MNKKIIFSAGGTGGHIFPAINLMKHFSEIGYEVTLVTDAKGKNFIKDHSKFKSYVLNAETTTKKNFFKKILALLVIFFSIIRSIFILKKEKPDLIFGFGGYVSFPISFSSKLFNLPLIIYENNMLLGRANKYLSFFSKKILVAKNIKENFSEKNRNKTFQVGSIIDKKIINYSIHKKVRNNKSFCVLVLGGSQGAEIFGNIIPSVIKEIKEKGFPIEVIQQCTDGQKNKIIEFYEKNKIPNHVFEFDSNIIRLILSSDLAITRCGASTTAELSYTLTPFIAVPLPSSIDNHQYLNGKYYKEKGCCWLLEQKDFNTQNLFNLIVGVIKNKNELENIRKSMKKECDDKVYSNIEKEVKDFFLK